MTDLRKARAHHRKITEEVDPSDDPAPRDIFVDQALRPTKDHFVLMPIQQNAFFKDPVGIEGNEFQHQGKSRFFF